MRRIGVLTYFWEDVPGQFFQALATQEALRSLHEGIHVEIVDVRHWHTRWRPGVRDLVAPHRFILRYAKRCKYERARHLLNISTVRCITRSPEEAHRFLEARPYDLLIVGSDVALRPPGKGRVLEDRPPLYWLPRDCPITHAMLASSADVTCADRLTVRQCEIMAQSAQGFHQLAVRDSMTFALLEALGLRNDPRLIRVPDPTFAYTVDNGPAQACWERAGIQSDKPLCGINLADTPFVAELARLLQEDFTLINIGPEPIPRAIPLNHLGPMEWSGLFAHLDMMVTRSFHESIFSCKHGCPIVAIDSAAFRSDPDTGASKTRCLMEEMGLPDSHVNPHVHSVSPEVVRRLIRKVQQNWDRSAVLARVESCRQRYLDVTRRLMQATEGLTAATARDWR